MTVPARDSSWAQRQLSERDCDGDGANVFSRLGGCEVRNSNEDRSQFSDAATVSRVEPVSWFTGRWKWCTMFCVRVVFTWWCTSILR